MQDSFDLSDVAIKEDIEMEALQVLLKLQYKKHEAQDMIKAAHQSNPNLATSEELLNEVYRQKRQLV